MVPPLGSLLPDMFPVCVQHRAQLREYIRVLFDGFYNPDVTAQPIIIQ